MSDVMRYRVAELFTSINGEGEKIQDASRVQEILMIPTEAVASEGDILRRRKV